MEKGKVRTMKVIKKLGSAIMALVFGTTALTSCDIAVSSMYHYEDASSYTMGGTELTETIREVDIDWVSGSVTVSYHDGDHVVISETSSGKLDEDSSLYYRVTGDTLEIEYAKSGVFTNFNFSKDLTVLLPRDEQLRELSFETVSADIAVEDVYVSECEVECVSGQVELNLLGTLEEVSIDTVSGNVSLMAHDGLRGLDVNSVSGNVEVFLHSDASFAVEFDSVSGDLDSDFAFKKTGKRYVVGNGTSEYEIKTVSGDATFFMLK